MNYSILFKFCLIYRILIQKLFVLCIFIVYRRSRIGYNVASIAMIFCPKAVSLLMVSRDNDALYIRAISLQ